MKKAFSFSYSSRCTHLLYIKIKEEFKPNFELFMTRLFSDPQYLYTTVVRVDIFDVSAGL